MHKTRLVKHIENYDHRKRPWYLREQGWSDVYFFSSNHHPAISANKKLSDKTGKLMGVFVTSISLDNISIFLKKIKVSKNSRIIITDPNGLILGTSFPQNLTDPKGNRIYGDKTDIPAVNKAVKMSFQSNMESFTIQDEGINAVVKRVYFFLPSGINWNILILTPEKDFTERFDEFTHQSILFLIIIFIISFITLQIMSKKLTRPITYLADKISRIAYNESIQNKPIIPPEIRDSSSEIKILSSNLEIMITRLNSAFSTIEKSRKEYKDLVENINTIIMKVAPDGTITYCNPYGLNFYGYTKEELIGNTVQKTVLRGDDEEPMEILRRIFIQDKKYWNGENRNITKEGRSVWILWSNRLIFDKNGKVVELLSTGQDITERKNAERKLENYLKKNSILLGEIHHRVKNNLQIIISLINLQLNKSENPTIEDALQGIKARIQSMAIVHEMLYSSTSFSEIDLYLYIQSLSNDISQTFRNEEKKIRISVFSKPVFLELEQAITVGLILNELLSNSIKYAFEDRSSGEIEISIKESADRRISITVKDNGIGIKDSGGGREGLGTVLIDALTQQLDAEVKKESSNGFCFQFTFNATGSSQQY